MKKFLFLPLLLLSCAPPQQSPQRPNILWITCEDMSPRLGCYGDPIATSPNIDQLAAQGMRFSNAFSISGVCAPSRSALITGMYPTSIGTQHMRTTHEAPGLPTPYLAVPPPEVKAFTEYLRAAGYYCTNSVKTDYQFGNPSTAWDESSQTAHWRDRKDGQPFFAVFNSTRTHESKVWPNPDEEPMLDPARVEVPPYYPDTATVRTDLARHYDNITRMDRWVAGILEELEEDGLAENTIVFFYSDHGDGLPRAKRWPYDSGIRVPLIVRWPGQIEPGSVDPQLVSFVDFGPTVLSLAGVDIPKHIQGQAFLGSQATQPRQYIYAARDRMDEVYDRIRVVRNERYKYIRNFQPEKPYVQTIHYRNRMPMMQELLRLNEEDRLEGPQKLWFQPEKPKEELYDLKTDPHEINNLADDPSLAGVLKPMRKALGDWLGQVGDLGEISEVEMVERMWPGGVQPQTAKPEIRLDLESDSSFSTARINCPTEGASIAYTTEEGDQPRWFLYTGPIELNDFKVLRAKAIRYGYTESDEAHSRRATM